MYSSITTPYSHFVLNGILLCEAGWQEWGNAQRLRDWMQVVTGAVISMCRSAPIAASCGDDSNFRHLAA